MTIDRRDLIEAFGDAYDLGTAGIFVGSGLSAAAGLPDWATLLEVPRVDSNVPVIPDLPLMAEYIVNEGTYPRQRLTQHILNKTRAKGVSVTDSHLALARLRVDQVWTTNYDPLIERADPEALVICKDDDVKKVGTARKTIIKMHGSINQDNQAWDEAPVITRSDFESYEDTHHRLWALLRASYLSKTLLFLGFSFADANIEILLRLARRHGMAAGNRHLTVLKKPDPSDLEGLRRHDLRVRDLEASGVRVHEVNDHSDLPGLLTELVRRTRPPRLFISGSGKGDDYVAACKHMADKLDSRVEWEISSLGGPAGWVTSCEIAKIRRLKKSYKASQFVIHFRWKDGAPPIEIDQRVGTMVFTHLQRASLVPEQLDECRALLVLGGGLRTHEEIDWATERGLGVVPLASSGGAALKYWQAHRGSPPELGGRETDANTWELLANNMGNVAADAAARLLAQAMYARR